MIRTKQPACPSGVRRREVAQNMRVLGDSKGGKQERQQQVVREGGGRVYIGGST